jgi:hypothetical protein
VFLLVQGGGQYTSALFPSEDETASLLLSLDAGVEFYREFNVSCLRKFLFL